MPPQKRWGSLLRTCGRGYKGSGRKRVARKLAAFELEKVNGDGPPALKIRGDCKMAMDWISRKAREGRKYREAVKGIPNNDLAMVV